MRHSDLQTGLSGRGTLDPVTEGSDSRYNIDLFYNNGDLSKDWDLDMELRYQDLDYTSGDGFQEHPPDYFDGTDTYPDGQIKHQSSAERRIVFETSGLYTGIKDHSLRIGAGYTWQDLYSVKHLVNFGTDSNGDPIPAGSPLVDISGSPYAFAPENTRKISHLFLQDIWTITNDWELTVGARYDDYSDFGDTVNPRIALVWQSTEKLTSKLIYGQAFRPPSYLELYDTTSFSTPNPDLDPEESETIELAFSYAASKDVVLGLNIYNFEQTDIITLDRSTGIYQNTGDHTIKGIELEARWQASKAINLYANYTQRDQDDSNLSAIQEPEKDAYLRADWGFLPKWHWNMQASWIGERPRRSTDTRPPMDDDLVTDTTIRFAASTSWEFAASVRNLFDADAREYTGGSIPDDLPLPERNIYAEMRYRF